MAGMMQAHQRMMPGHPGMRPGMMHPQQMMQQQTQAGMVPGSQPGMENVSL